MHVRILLGFIVFNDDIPIPEVRFMLRSILNELEEHLHFNPSSQYLTDFGAQA